MRDITKINPRYVGRDGKYFNTNTMTQFTLTAEEIYYLRKYYGDDPKNPRIASDVKIIVRKPADRNQPKRKKKTTLVRNNKYNDGFHQLKEQIKKEIIGFLVVGGITVTLLGGVAMLTDNKPVNLPDATIYDVASVFDDVDIVIEEKDYSMVIEVAEQREKLIREICNIYQVNYDIVYPALREMTDEFSSPDFLTGTIPGLSCKGMHIVANSEEELFVYAIRIIKQEPQRWNINTNNLYIKNGYSSGTDYCEQIEHIADVIGVDKYLMYAIVQSETGFRSDLFINSNNPAGLKSGDGGWWEFDTKEEGLYELGMQILCYYDRFGLDINDVSPEAVALIGSVHAPLSDGNTEWVPNVLDRYEYARRNSEELFGTQVQSNGLSH